ncbi:MAG: amidohydrolase [Armatimonadetes bacterium]|nr:amidohydrolase [Armatimonadota bacterium]
MAPADLIFINGTFLSCSESRGEYLAVRGGRIVGFGPKGEFESFRGPRTEILDLGGKTVLPGFIDSHVHFVQTGLNLSARNLTSCSSIAEIQESLSDGKDGGWILGHGFDDFLLKEKRFPTREDLDQVSKDRPLFISRRDHHSCVLNSKGVETLELPSDLEGGDLALGIFRAMANNVVRSKVYKDLDDGARWKAIRAASRLAVERGVTTLHALEGGTLFSDRDIEAFLRAIPLLEVKCLLYWQTRDVRAVQRLGLSRIGGCLLIDGSLGSRTAALSSPYDDDPSTSGVLYFSEEELYALVSDARKAGLQTSFHAIGDRAIELVLDAYERVLREIPREDGRLRIEHCELPTPEQIERIRSLGVALGVQPAFEQLWGGPDRMYAERLGKERAAQTNPFASMLDKGILLAGGSDSDVTPLDPILGLHAAINHPNRAQQLTVEQGIRLFTVEGARIGFEERRKGTIECGKEADLVVLSGNPLTTRASEIKELSVLMTFVDGKCVYRRITDEGSRS